MNPRKPDILPVFDVNLAANQTVSLAFPRAASRRQMSLVSRLSFVLIEKVLQHVHKLASKFTDSSGGHESTWDCVSVPGGQFLGTK